MAAHGEDLDPVEGPIIRLWYFGPLLLLLFAFATLGAVVTVERFPLWVRIACAGAVWAGPSLLLPLVLLPWMRRLDEFQQSLVTRAMAMAGATTVGLVVFLGFYFLLLGSGGPQTPYIVIGEAPVLYLLMMTLQIAWTERSAARRKRAAGA